ncbi:PP2C family protein-serine/threonine phosphatase [Geotalea toluenoxydans]
MERSRILLVDDTPENLELLAEILGESYATISAGNGEAALVAASTQPLPDLILLDINMPDMDGYEVCRRLKEDPLLREIPVIFLSGLDATQDKVKAFKAGGVDYITKPFQFDEMQARVTTHVRLRQFQSELEQKRRELQDAYDRLDREFRCVGEVQKSLLPDRLPDVPGFDLASYYCPARRAGGDYFDVLPVNGKRWGIFVADVTGHGPPAAIVTAMTHVMLHLAPCKDHPDQLLSFLNRTLYGRTQEDQFVTAFYGILDPDSGEFIFSSAGHPPPLLCKKTENSRAVCFDAGLPLGINPLEEYTTTRQILATGDIFLLYTDGITEAARNDGEMFGLERLMTVSGVQRNLSAGQFCERLCQNVDLFRGGAEQGDDVTVLVLKAK